MGFSEGLSDTGEFTGRGNPMVRGSITGVGTFLGGILHTLPFLIPHYQAALVSAIVVVAFELVVLAYLRWRFFDDRFLRALSIVTFAGVIIAAVSAGARLAAREWRPQRLAGVRRQPLDLERESLERAYPHALARVRAARAARRPDSPRRRTLPRGSQGCTTTASSPISASEPTAGRGRCVQRHQNAASPTSIAAPPATAA